VTPSTVRSISRLAFTQHGADGVLTAYTGGSAEVPFPIARVFTITGVSQNGVRGGHAHFECTQLVACIRGRVTVTVHDGAAEVTEELTSDGSALLIPPILWNTERFEDPQTVLAVFCDQAYDPADYLRDWEEYLRLKAAERGERLTSNEH
jgi:hypothetical protein